MEYRTVLLIGAGNLGGRVLDHLATLSFNVKVVVGARDVDQARVRVNLSRLCGMHFGASLNVEIEQLDLLDVDRTTSLIASLAPDVIFNATTLQSWWVITTLPQPAFARLEPSHVGPWLPMHYTLVYYLMKAVRASGVRSLVVNTAYPDVVHPSLHKIGLAPDVGIGNVSNVIPALRCALAEKLMVDVERVSVRMCAHHYVSHRVSRAGESGDAPFHLTVLVDGEDRSADVDLSTVFDLLPTRFRRPGGRDGQAMTAASAMAVLNAVLRDSGALVHAPGPCGLPGGYPVRVDASGATVELPDDLSLAEAVKINEEGARFDGIDRIADDGSVHFSEREMGVLERELSYAHEQMRPEESHPLACELASKYQEFARCVSA